MRVTRKEVLFEGRVIRLMRYYVETPDGVQTREIVEHRGAVAILAFPRPDVILLEYRYRPALDKMIYELPAGVLKPGEDPISCAKRELLEETGYEAEDMEYLCCFYPTPGYTNEVIHIVVAEKLRYVGKPQAEMSPEEKYMEVREVPLAEVINMIMRGEIQDGKTMLGVFMYLAKKRGKLQV